MTPAAASALLAMGQCIGSEMAEHWARLALERGATHEEITEAWRLWRAERESEVQTIGSLPRPDTRCACPHVAREHHSGTGRCLSRACGCLSFRPAGRPTSIPKENLR